MYAIIKQTRNVQHSGWTEDMYKEAAMAVWESENDGRAFEFWDALDSLRDIFAAEANETSRSAAPASFNEEGADTETSDPVVHPKRPGQKKAKAIQQFATMTGVLTATLMQTSGGDNWSYF